MGRTYRKKDKKFKKKLKQDRKIKQEKRRTNKDKKDYYKELLIQDGYALQIY